MDFSKFRRNLAVVRKSKEFSSKELSRLAELKQFKRINDIEEGRGMPSIDEIYSICKVLNVSMDDMIEKTIYVKYEWK